jgi:hypothetical protein
MAAKILTQGRQLAPIQCKSIGQRATNVQPGKVREIQALSWAHVLSPMSTHRRNMSLLTFGRNDVKTSMLPSPASDCRRI